MKKISCKKVLEALDKRLDDYQKKIESAKQQADYSKAQYFDDVQSGLFLARRRIEELCKNKRHK